MIKKIMYFFMMSLSLLAISCKQNVKGKLEVVCTYKNADKLFFSSTGKIYLEEIVTGKDQGPVAIDSVKLSGNSGTISLSGKIRGSGEEIFEVVFGDNILGVPLINDAGEIHLDIDLGKKDNFYEVTGSDASKELKTLIDDIGKKNFAVERSFADLDSLKRLNVSDTVILAATTAKNNAIKDLNSYLKNFIENGSNPTLNALALGWASRSYSQVEFETELNSLIKRFPTNTAIVDMKKNYDAQKAQMAQMQQKKDDNSWINKQAPDFALPDATGKMISIASFKGKYLLVDFWASWCSPCRMENPNVVKAYAEFKAKNFAILGVSLDKEKDAWQEAIQSDKLAWAQVSDLKYWNSKAVEVFKFEGIPFNILIDPEGKVIAQELRGTDLENKLKEVLP
jgi:peroxiredoxin